MRRLNSEFTTKYISEAGSKRTNKDYFGFVEMDNFACWVVAESYDNDIDVISSQLVVDTVIDKFTRKPTLSKRKLKSYVKEAHIQLKQQSNKFQLKASILIVVTNYTKMRCIVCGNSKLHVFRGSNVFLKSKDQSLYQSMLNDKEIPDDGEKGMEESRNLFDFLGKKGRLKISLSKKIPLMDEDILLITTWGFWEKVSTIEMLDALDKSKKPLEYLDELQDLFLSKQDGTVNNYTLATVFVNKVFQEKKIAKKIIKMIIMISIPIIIIAIILGIVSYRANLKRQEKITAVTEFELQGNLYIEDENYDRALAEYGSGITKTKELKETKGKKGKENKVIKDRLNSKERVAQLIIDGDTLFENKKYEQAKLNFQKALKEAKYDMDFYDLLNIETIEKKVLLCDEFQYIDDLIQLADAQAELEDYEKALKNYKEAQNTAAACGNRTAEKEIKLKIDELESKMKESQKEKDAEEEEKEQEILKQKELDGGSIELEGDKAVSEEDYALANDCYNQAIEIYKELNNFDKASATEKKIKEVNDTIKQQADDIQISIADGYVAMGDQYMEDNKLEEAVSNYKMAKDIYNQFKKADEVVETIGKINKVNDAKKELETAQAMIEIKDIEKKGDEALKSKNYSAAKESYKQAQTLYQGINQLDKVLAIQEKIKSAEDLEAEGAAEAEKANAQENDTAKKEKTYTGQKEELYAKEAVKDKDYKKAINHYIEAINNYQSAGEFDKAIEAEKKMLEAQALLDKK